MTEPPPRYWFPAKRYGWGWGAPRTWQGWAVLAGYVVVLLVGVALGRPLTWLVVLLATAALLVVCLRRGEPAAWRWGGR